MANSNQDVQLWDLADVMENQPNCVWYTYSGKPMSVGLNEVELLLCDYVSGLSDEYGNELEPVVRSVTVAPKPLQTAPVKAVNPPQYRPPVPKLPEMPDLSWEAISVLNKDR